MYYLDSNMVIYAAGDSGEKGEWCRSIISKIENEEISACTSYITYDEFFYKIRKEFGHSEALMISKSFLGITNLTFFPLDKVTIQSAHNILEKYLLNPRDALHIATALGNCDYVISEDSDFNNIPFIERKWLTL